jgi:hypothetical protein
MDQDWELSGYSGRETLPENQPGLVEIPPIFSQFHHLE